MQLEILVMLLIPILTSTNLEKIKEKLSKLVWLQIIEKCEINEIEEIERNYKYDWNKKK